MGTTGLCRRDETGYRVVINPCTFEKTCVTTKTAISKYDRLLSPKNKNNKNEKRLLDLL